AAEERRAGLDAVRVGVVALRVVAVAAVGTVAASDRRGDDHAVARLQVAHVAADLLDDADTLVPQDGARLHPGHGATDHVQVGPADGAGRQPDDGVGRLLDLRLGHGLQTDVADAVKNDCFHGFVPLLGMALGGDPKARQFLYPRTLSNY